MVEERKSVIGRRALEIFMGQAWEGLTSLPLIDHWLVSGDHVGSQRIGKCSLAVCPGRQGNSFGGQLAVSATDESRVLSIFLLLQIDCK